MGVWEYGSMGVLLLKIFFTCNYDPGKNSYNFINTFNKFWFIS